MHARVRPCLFTGIFLFSALLIAPLSAATPRDELLRFVPADVGFCVVIQNLRENGKALAESPFVDQFRKSVFGKKLQEAGEIQQLLRAEKELQKYLGIGWDELRDDILGDAVVFAYKPGKAGEEQDLMLIRARSAKALSDLIERFNKAQLAAGDLKELKELKYKNLVYHGRVEKKATTYYHLRGPVLVFSGQEKMLQQALDLDLTGPADAEPALTTWLRQLGADRALLAVYLNPRAFDAELAAKAEEAGSAVLKTFLVYWKALDGAALSLTLDRDAMLAIGVRGRSEDLPAAARRLFAALAKPSDLWKQCPDDALLAVGGRIDFAALAEVLGDFLPPENRKKLFASLNLSTGRADVVKDVLPFVGPDWALWLTAPAEAKHIYPESLFALRMNAGDKMDPVDKALLARLHFFAEFAVLGHGQHFPDKPLLLKTGTFDKHDVKYLESEALPPGVRPAFALKDGFLALASTPELIGRFMVPSASASEGPAPLLRISFKAWRGYILARRAALAQMLSAKEDLKPDEAQSRIDGVLTALEFIERLEVRQQTGKGHAVVSIVLRTAQPLRK